MSDQNPQEDIQLLEGCPISRELQVPDLSAMDQFLVSVPLNGQSVSNFYRSRRVSYQKMMDDIYGAIYKDINLGTMATESKYDYAKKNHDHFQRYSRVSVEQHYFRDTTVSEEEDVVIVLGHIVIDGISYDICIPKLDQSLAPKKEIKIGAMKFLAVPQTKPIDVYAEDFDGWVYPDGREVPISRFPKAYEVFRSIQDPSVGAQMFKIPRLQDFLECNPGVYKTNLMDKVKYNIGLKKHSHMISQIKATGTCQVSGYIKDYRVTGTKQGDEWVGNDYTGYHHGSGLDPENKIAGKLSLNVENFKLYTDPSTESNSVDKENHPKYMYVPALIYIGEPQL